MTPHPHVWHQGRVIPAAQAAISPFDHGFLYGAGAFETIAVVEGTPLFLPEHLDRLASACAELEISLASSRLLAPWTACRDAGPALDAVCALLSAEGRTEAIARLVISAGTGYDALPSGPYQNPVELIQARPLRHHPGQPAAAVPLHLLELRRTAAENGGNRLKSLCYLNNVLAWRELSRRCPGLEAEGVLLDAAGNVAEAVASNLFFVADGRLHTPDLSTGALPGIARAVVLSCARAAGIPVEEGLFPAARLAQADAVFLANSVRPLVPASELRDEKKELVRSYSTVHHPLFIELTARFHDQQQASLRPFRSQA